MAQSNYQEPIEQKDLDLGKKITEGNKESESVLAQPEKKENMPVLEQTAETGGEKAEEKVSEKIETARQTIGAQAIKPAANVATDAQTVAQIQEYEKKVEKLMEIAVQKGPKHAIKVAQHMDKGKDPAMADNYTIDEIHDRLVEDELRKQLVQKGLLKEL
ncbi:MAG: hypothetical protein PHF35_04200 [Candidatus Moranbacteria bacterium]|nr:hypothetical protein [Candidatus Moranbacteria bacterium]